jgi:hypothetical protein
MHLKAHPKKGISNNSLLTILVFGMIKVCINKDSHCPDGSKQQHMVHLEYLIAPEPPKKPHRKTLR